MKLTHTPVPKLTSSYPDGNTELLNGAKQVNYFLDLIVIHN